MRILIAPNSFKHAMTSFQVAEMIMKGFKKSKLKAEYKIFPIADGGNGTLDLINNTIGGEIINCKVHDPLGRLINSRYGFIASSKIAVIEMAEASGIHLLKDEERNPLLATSYGTGELIKHALDNDSRKIIVGLGGSASIDGGAGILQALGISLLNEHGLEIEKGGGALGDLASLNVKGLHPKLQDCEIVVACDVNSPLLGEKGAVEVFGPQKGAAKGDIIILENNLKNFAEVIFKNCKVDITSLIAGGAAGGVSAGLHGVLNASIVNGLEYILELTGFEKDLKHSDLLITAEGKFDSQTLEGKGPFGVAKLAYENKVPVIVFAGQVSDEIDFHQLKQIEAVFSISRGPGSLQDAIFDTGKDLSLLAHQVGNLIQMSQQIS
ncbi:MAG: glycerate kinase [Bacteroidota bacterium]|nr:glycerate kinase [Bacteroidota bacterium]